MPRRFDRSAILLQSDEVIRKIITLLSAPVIMGMAFLAVPGSIAHAAEAGTDQGLVIFHRQNESAGRAIRFNIEQDGRPIGQLLAGSTLEVPLAPGAYTFTVRVPSLDGMDYLTLNIEAGKTYRVQGEVRIEKGSEPRSQTALKITIDRPKPVGDG